MKTKRQLRKETEELRALLADVTEKAEALLPRVEALIQERNALKKNVSDLGYENTELLEQVAALDAEVYDLECQLNDLEYEVDEDQGCLPPDVPLRPDQEQGDSRWTKYDPTAVPFA